MKTPQATALLSPASDPQPCSCDLGCVWTESFSPVVDGVAVVGTDQGEPDALIDGIADEADGAICKANVDAARMPAARLGLPAGPAKVEESGVAAHAVAGADAGVIDVGAALDIVGRFVGVVGRGAIADGV